MISYCEAYEQKNISKRKRERENEWRKTRERIGRRKEQGIKREKRDVERENTYKKRG